MVDRLTLLRLRLGEEFQLYDFIDFADVCCKHTFEQVFLAFITLFSRLALSLSFERITLNKNVSQSRY